MDKETKKELNESLEELGQPKSYLAIAILVTLFCRLPFGIAGIVYAARVNSLWAAGQYEAAYDASENAKKWSKYGLIGGIAICILYAIAIAAGIVQP